MAMFSKDGVTTVILSQEPTYPRTLPKTHNRFIGVSDDNSIQVANIGPSLQTIPLQFRQLTRVDGDNLDAFFTEVGASEFTYTDNDGAEYQVQNLDPTFAVPEVSFDNVQFEVILTRV